MHNVSARIIIHNKFTACQDLKSFCNSVFRIVVLLGDNAQNTLSDSVGGRIPDKYFVVTNSDLVRIRYLLVYTQDLNTTR